MSASLLDEFGLLVQPFLLDTTGEASMASPYMCEQMRNSNGMWIGIATRRMWHKTSLPRSPVIGLDGWAIIDICG